MDIYSQLTEKNFAILDENIDFNFYFNQLDMEKFENIELKSWINSKILKIYSGKIFDLMLKLEKIIFPIYEELLNTSLKMHFNSKNSLTSSIYYSKESGFHESHNDWGIFNIVIQDNSPNCMYIYDKEWKLLDNRYKICILNGEYAEKYSHGKLKSCTHKVIKPYGFERKIITKICYPSNENLKEKVNNWL